jgi:hypothetical protein
VAGDGDRLLARGEQEPVRVRDQVDEMVRVHVGDDHRVDVRVVDLLTQLGEDPVAAVEEDVRLTLAEQVAAAGAAGVLPGRRLTEHRDLHPRDSNHRKGRELHFGGLGELAAICEEAPRAPRPAVP